MLEDFVARNGFTADCRIAIASKIGRTLATLPAPSGGVTMCGHRYWRGRRARGCHPALNHVSEAIWAAES